MTASVAFHAAIEHQELTTDYVYRCTCGYQTRPLPYARVARKANHHPCEDHGVACASCQEQAR